MAILNLAGAERLRNKSVQAEKKAASKQRKDDENIRAEADGAHGNRAVRQMANHYRVDDRHAHPAEFREDQRQRQTDGGSQFDAECFQVSSESVRGTEKWRKSRERNDLQKCSF